MDVASCGLGRISGGDDDVDAFRPRGSFRHPDRRDFRISECHARDGRVIGLSVDAAQSPCDHLTVVVSEVGEPTESRDVACPEDAGPCFERRRDRPSTNPAPSVRARCCHASTLGRRPVATSNRSAETAAPDFKWRTMAERWRDGCVVCFSTAIHGSPIMTVIPSASRCGRSAVPPRALRAQGAWVQPRSGSPWTRDVRKLPELDAVAPAPRIASDTGISFGIAACRLVQYSTVSSPGIVGMAAVLPLAITTARRAMSCSSRPSTVRRSVSVPSPRESRAPGASIAAAARLSSRLRAIDRTRLETLGKSTVHSTRDAARRRARWASVNVSLERSRVLEGTQPQDGHSPPTSSRSTTASLSPLSRRPTAIASPATPPPRHTTSNSCGKSYPQ